LISQGIPSTGELLSKYRSLLKIADLILKLCNHFVMSADVTSHKILRPNSHTKLFVDHQFVEI